LVIDDDPGIPESLREIGFNVVNWASTYEEGQQLLAREHESDVTILVDHRLNDGLLGTDLIAEHAIRSRVFLCTNDFDNPEVIRRARQVGVQILPKPLCILAEPKFVTMV
jgi:DNA-binding NarL/FixJ family response regulator